jgi:signal transduction histidine kinase
MPDIVFRFIVILLFSATILFGTKSFGQIVDQAAEENPNIEGWSYPVWQDSVLHVTGDYNFKPYEFLNEQGQPDGFTVNIIKAIADVMKLKIDIELKPWVDVRRQVEQGEVDLVTGMYFTHERNKKVDFSIPHFISSYSLFIRKGTVAPELDELEGKVVLVQNGDLGHDYLLAKYPDTRMIVFQDLGDVFEALSEGVGDCAFHSRLQGLRYLTDNEITNVKDSGKAMIQKKYCIAVPEGHAEMLAIINEGLSIIKTNGTYDRIYDEWFGVYEKQVVSWQDVLKYLLWIIVPLLLLILVFVIWSYTLRQQVRKRTSELNIELEHRQAIQKQLEQIQKQLQEQNNELLQQNDRIASMNTELRIAKARAEENDNLKTTFLANMSHENRTPLNSIKGFCELMEIEALDPVMQKYTSIISQSAQRLLRLLDDIIDISKIESGVLGFSISHTYLKPLLKELFDNYQITARNKGLELVMESDPVCEDLRLKTDPNRLMQVFSNFLSNALKHTEKGRIVVGCRKEKYYMRFWVTDTGHGIPEDDLPHVFERFYQAGNHQAGGTGLGLAIARRIVDHLKGEIGVESRENEGTTFWFTHPLRND